MTPLNKRPLSARQWELLELLSCAPSYRQLRGRPQQHTAEALERRGLAEVRDLTDRSVTTLTYHIEAKLTPAGTARVRRGR